MSKQKRYKKQRMRRRIKPIGRNWMPLICAALLILSAWEFCVRLDAMYKPLKMFFELAAGEGIPLKTAMNYFDWSILEPPLWLLSCALTGILALFLSRRMLGCVLLIPVCAALAAYGLTREGTLLTDLWRLAQPALLLMLTAFGVINLLVYPLRRRRLPAASVDSLHESPRFGDAPRLSRISYPVVNAAKPKSKRYSDRHHTA